MPMLTCFIYAPAASCRSKSAKICRYAIILSHLLSILIFAHRHEVIFPTIKHSLSLSSFTILDFTLTLTLFHYPSSLSLPEQSLVTLLLFFLFTITFVTRPLIFRSPGRLRTIQRTTLP